MWIVKVALDRPYTFIVFAVLIVLLGVFTILRTARDIFPVIPIPVVVAVWNYAGLPPDDMASRVLMNTERNASTAINDIEHTESQSTTGLGFVKYFFQAYVNQAVAYAQITASSQAQLRSMPPGMTPPYVVAFDASSVPILQLALASPNLSEAEIQDLALIVVRTNLSTVPGAQTPFPQGGKSRQVQVDLNPAALRANGLSATDVSAAVGAQNLILPAGSQKIGDLEYFVKLNASPKTVEELNDIPIAQRNGRIIYMRDVAHVRDGSGPQTNIVRLNGRRAVLMSILKSGGASTLDIVNGVKERLPGLLAALPPGLSVNALSDQSVFVKASITGVIQEGIIAAALTGVLIMLFLGSIRSTLIITISIPLSVLMSIICLSALGQTINIMTLGGLAVAVGILVDNATVTIENMNYHLEMGKDVETAIMDGARQITMPALVSTLAICIVFIPMFLLTGIAHYLFVPLAEAAVFAVLSSYFLSRTLVPTLAKYWLRPHKLGESDLAGPGFGWLVRLQYIFESWFEDVRKRYHSLLEAALTSGQRFAAIFLGAMAATAVLAFPIGPLPGLGQDFFPSVDAGQIKLHLRARSGTRVEETAVICDHVEEAIKRIIPTRDIASIVDSVGMPTSGLSVIYGTSGTIGPGDADIYITLNEDHASTQAYIAKLRARLNEEFPSVSFAFLPADITSQILNFGIPAPIDVQITGFDAEGNRKYANIILSQMRRIPGLVDARIQQTFDYPQVNVTVNRSNAQSLGFTQANVASNLLIALSGSYQTSPSFWLDQRTLTEYSLTTQVPQYRLDSINSLANLPLPGTAPGADAPLLANVADFTRSAGSGVVSHYNAQPAIDIYGAVEGTDLGYVASEVNKIVDETRKDLPRASHVQVRGQVQTMVTSFNGLLIGLAGAIVLVYLLIVVNFQSWVDPFIIITGLPAALAGIVWMLFLTYTTVSVPVLTGAIMCMGVATANSILVVSFARERMDQGLLPRAAALEAGITRLRPVLMTAAAMIVGMVPMALGMGDGGEQNAPLGRAVIGGLLFATVATLFFVPVVFMLVHDRLLARTGRSSGEAHARA